MICNNCKNPGILNQANGQDFYYCRTCKDEIHPTKEDWDALHDEIMAMLADVRNSPLDELKRIVDQKPPGINSSEGILYSLGYDIDEEVDDDDWGYKVDPNYDKNTDY